MTAVYRIIIKFVENLDFYGKLEILKVTAVFGCFMKQKNELKITFEYYSYYYEIAQKNYFDILNLCENKKKIDATTDESIVCICEENRKIELLAINTIIFSCMCLESFINSYAISRFSRQYFDNYLDKLDMKSKWVIIPMLVKGIQIQTDDKCFTKFKELIAKRNRLVHDKTKVRNVNNILASDFLTEEDAEDAVFAVKQMVVLLKNIDINVEDNWLQDRSVE